VAPVISRAVVRTPTRLAAPTARNTAVMKARRGKPVAIAGTRLPAMSATAAAMPPLASRSEIISSMPVTKPAAGPNAASTVP
jgi:hypothetical protein